MLTAHLQKIGSTRPDSKNWRDQYASPPDSRPATPKSVRPPLPNDIDAELRAACTYIITHPKPSHEVWEVGGAKPALDYAAIKAGADHVPPPPAPGPARKPSIRKNDVRQDLPSDPTKYSYKPNVPVDELFRQDERNQLLPQTTARSRADQLMAPDPPKHASITTNSSSSQGRSEPHSHSHSQHQQHITVKSEGSEKPRTSGRSDSVGTSGSTPQTDSTEYPWSASTPMTSAVITPARSSKRTSQNVHSGSESGSAPRVEAVNAEWMRLELEKHKKAIEEREKEREKYLEEAARLAAETTPTQGTTTVPTPMSQVPPRKAVPSRPGSRQARDISRPTTRSEAGPEYKDLQQVPSRGRADSGRAEASQQQVDEPRGRVPTRSNSRLGKASRAATRAASRAGSITNDILTHYLRPGSNQPFQSPTSPTERQRSSSRTRAVAQNVRDYFRPASRAHGRAGSIDSTRSGNSAVSPSEHSNHKWKGWRPLNKNHAHITPDMSRPGSSASRPGTKEQRQSPQQQKPVVDLNRELPPLPSLDQWKPVQPAQPTEPEKTRTAATVNTVIAPAYQGIKRVLSKREKWATPTSHLSKEDIVSARMGSPTPPRSQKQSVDVKRINPNMLTSNPLPSPPPMSPSDMDFKHLSLSKSAEPLKPNDPSSGRLRSKSNQTSRPELVRNTRPHLLRSPSSQTQAPPTPEREREKERPVQISGNPNLVHHARAVAAGLVKDPTRPAPRQGGSSTANQTPHGHSRENSDKARAARKYSMDDYDRIDPRFQNTVEIQARQEQAAKEKSKKRWWHHHKDRSQANWMDQVVKSGARNGVLLTDDIAAGSPIVRY